MRRRRNCSKNQIVYIFDCILRFATFGLFPRSIEYNNEDILSENDDMNPVTTPIQPPRQFDINTVKNSIAKIWIPYRQDLVTKVIFEEPGELQYRNDELLTVLGRFSSHFTLNNNHAIELFTRPLLPTDAERLHEIITKKLVSSHSLFLRFNRPILDVPDALLTYLTNIDYEYHFAVSAGCVVDGKWEICGVARYIQERNDPEMAEWSALVVDKYHGNRIGSAMLYYLSLVAYQQGIRHFYAIVNPRNNTVLHWMKKLKGVIIPYNGVNVWTFDIPIYSEWIMNPQVKNEIHTSASGTNSIENKYRVLLRQEIDNIKNLELYKNSYS